MFSSEFGDLFNGTIDGGSQLSSSDLSMTSSLTLLRNVSAAPPSGSLAPVTTTTAIINPERASPSGGCTGAAQLPSAADPHTLEHLFRPDLHHLRPDSQSALTSTLAIPDSSPYPDVSKRHTTMKKEQRPVTEHASLSSSAAGKLNSTNAAVAFPAQTSHARGTLRCPFCDKVFSNSSAIAKHKLTHSEERKYVCSICHKAFKRQDHLNGHKYTHESKKPHACHFCEKSYSDARSLRRHYENAHPEEYERWLILSQATNGDPSAITVAAVALLSSSGLVDKEEPGSARELNVTTNSSNIGENAHNGSAAGGQTSDALPPDPSALLSALSSPVCKLLASSLSRAAAQNKTDDSPASSITIDGQGNVSSTLLKKSLIIPIP
ncbi:zinc finger, C2H2 type [Opisthorchis viverrini]|uniref:Zinc finger, C2H2 type n=1 Tax=Opisthorchis viverrini TaxID=6198 RepID=A0A1S8X154_OPIVI|nr:zinc finger, C2H2 type [Opisthorchis viverrini]